MADNHVLAPIQIGSAMHMYWQALRFLMESGQWRIAPNGKLPTGRAGLGSVELGARLYVIGGSDASGQYYRDVLSSRFDFGQP